MTEKQPTKNNYSLKDYYLAYYWLILYTFPPYLRNFTFITTPDPNNPKTRMPECIYTAMDETDRPDLPVWKGLMLDVNAVFTWLIKKGIPRLHRRNGKPISCIDDLGVLYDELKKKIPEGYGMDKGDWIRNVEAYLLPEHQENLRKLESPFPPGAGGEATETPGAWGKVGEFVKKHWQWLITTILQIIASIRR